MKSFGGSSILNERYNARGYSLSLNAMHTRRKEKIHKYVCIYGVLVSSGKKSENIWCLRTNIPC